jgi:hypothetical protein
LAYLAGWWGVVEVPAAGWWVVFDEEEVAVAGDEVEPAVGCLPHERGRAEAVDGEALFVLEPVMMPTQAAPIGPVRDHLGRSRPGGRCRSGSPAGGSPGRDRCDPWP